MSGFAGSDLLSGTTSSVFLSGFARRKLERVKGIEPSSSAWKAVALPLSYTRLNSIAFAGSHNHSVTHHRHVTLLAFACRAFPAALWATSWLSPFGVLADGEWWRGLDSNQRRRSQRIYSPSPLATRAPLRIHFPTRSTG